MKVILFWFTRLAGILLILVQLYKYFFTDAFSWGTLKDRPIVYDLAFLLGFNLFLLGGIILLFISNRIKKRNYSTGD